jgi:hypothetical protein
MTSKKYNTLGRITALVSFLLGMLIFGMYFFTSKGEFLFLGYGFVVLTGMIHLIILIAILIKVPSDKGNKKGLLKTAGLMLLNVPIMFACMWMVMILMGTMRITFINQTDHKLTDLKITGCETKHIAELEPQESKTVWVGITGDCSINLGFKENGEKKNEMVAGYVTHGMGHKMNHNIGRENHKS